MWKTLREFSTVDLIDRETNLAVNVLTTLPNDEAANFTCYWNVAHGFADAIEEVEGYALYFDNTPACPDEEYYADFWEVTHAYREIERGEDFITYEFDLYENHDTYYLVTVHSNYHVDIINERFYVDSELKRFDYTDVTSVAKCLAKRDGILL